jgi:hypothetical protein
MNNWASQRKFAILASLILLFAIVVSVPVYFTYFNNKPTCSDHKMDGTETGIDCGGICLKVCPAAATAPIIHFARAFQIENGNYNVVALVENVNPSYVGLNASYSFKLYDSDNILVAERDGTTTLLPHKLFPIFESDVDAGNKVPARVVFQFNSIGEWQRSAYVEPLLQISNQSLSTSSSPRVDADVDNQTLDQLQNVQAVALLSDANDNVVASSRTYADSIGPDATTHLIFTWPKPFDSAIDKIEILTEVLPENISQ